LKCINLVDISTNDPSKLKEIESFYLLSILKIRYDNYFNEGGYKVIDEIDPLTQVAMTGIYLPVILIGNPGMGKSTFINVIAKERISKATSSVEPVTSKVSYYDIKIPCSEDNNMGIDNNLLKEDAYFRFIDTPGFDQKKDVNIAIKEIDDIFKKFEEGKERIPVILYFLQSGRSFGNEKDKKDKTIKLLRS
jgi:GTP-binding protein EngB required for normal cell division